MFVGLILGAAVAVAILIGAVLLLPDPGSAAIATASPAGTAGAPATTPTPGGPTPSLQATVGTVGFHIGESAPALSVVQLAGGQIDLANLKGRPVWINFMQTTCVPCVDEFPLMSGFAARYAESGLVVIAIDVREDESTVVSFVSSLNAQFPIGLDTDGLVAEAWGAITLPIHFWVDREGIIRAGALGGIGPDVMAERLGTILPGVQVTP